MHFHALLSEWNRQRHGIRVIASRANRKEFDRYQNLDIAVIRSQAEADYLPHLGWADVYYAPLNGLWPRHIPQRLPVVASVLDLRHLVQPQHFSRAMWEARNHDYGYVIERADRLIAISEYEKRNVAAFYGKSAVDVVHLGGYLAERLPEAELGSGIDGHIGGREFAIYPAVPWTHKNHINLLHAWKIYTEKFGGSEVLVLTGAIEHSDIVGKIGALVGRLVEAARS